MPFNEQILGTVIASVLDYDHLSKLTNDPKVINPQVSSWVPADGRSIAGSQLATITGNSNAPDLRGRFVRGLNEIYSVGEPALNKSTADPDGDNRKPGDYQDDNFEAHSHSVTDHSAPFAFPTSGMGIQSDSGQQIQFGKPNISINATGGSETRPRNISLYFYIKIN